MTQIAGQIRERVSLRKVLLPDDELFLQDLYASTRDDLSGLADNESQLSGLLLMQYNGQKMTYSAEFPHASHYIVLLDGAPVGRLIVDRRPDAVHGVDLSLLKPYRNLGVGTVVIAELFDECSDKGVPLIFSVVKTNPAARLYHRLGCRINEDMGTHFSMIWAPNTSA